MKKVVEMVNKAMGEDLLVFYYTQEPISSILTNTKQVKPLPI